MSKEQTPITAEEFLETSIAPDECRFGAEAVDYCYTTDEVQYHMEQYAKAKVLEALEREFKKIDVQYYESGFGNKEQGGKYYYETEVKLKYEL